MIIASDGDSERGPGNHALTGATFVAALAPMVTVPSLRRLIIDVHGGSTSSLHVFVALGMLGGALGAPLVARRADAVATMAPVAMGLALVDSGVEAASSLGIPEALLYLLRPIHGAASMGLLAILLAKLRSQGTARLSRGAAASIVALALGPALGGLALSHGGVATPFRVAAGLMAILVVLLYVARHNLARSEGTNRDVTSIGPVETTTLALLAKLRRPLTVLGTQRMAIGALVSTWAIVARQSLHLSDARVGASFSVFLTAFALATLLGGRRLADRPKLIACGGLTMGAAFVALATGPRALAFPLLGIAGVGAALAYSPALALVGQLSEGATRVRGMALAHAAGALGMVLGPAVGAVFDRQFAGFDVNTRAMAFLCLVGTVHAVATVALAVPRHRPQQEATSPTRLEGTSETT